MRNKEIATALGLSVALAVTGCGTTNEPVETVQVEESTPTEIEEPTEPVEVIEADTTAPEISTKENIKGVDFGATIKPEDYAEAKDENDVTLFFVTESGDETELEIPADLDISVTEINFTVVAVDSEGNRSDEITVTIPIVHDFSCETVEKEDDGKKYSDDEFNCDTCGFEYTESPLDEEINPPYHFDNDKDYEIIPMDDTTMYAKQYCNVRSGPATTYDKVDSLETNQKVTVIGKVERDGKTWYVIKSDDTANDHMVNASLLSTTKPKSQSSTPSTPSAPSNPIPSDCSSGDCSDCMDCACDIYGNCLGDCSNDCGGCMSCYIAAE